MIKYLPTVDGKPARFDGEQLCYVSTYSRGRSQAVLLDSLAEVRKQIKASQKYRDDMGFRPDMRYGYVRVEVQS